MTPSLKRDTWQQHIQAWQQSQLSKKAYCREHNLNSACFYKWYSKLALKPAAPQPALASAMNSLTLIPLTRPKTLHLVTHLSLHSPKGWRIDCPVPLYSDTLPERFQMQAATTNA